MIAILNSLFLYINYFLDINLIFFNTIFGLLGIYLILKYHSPIYWFYIGFFISILWFWWISIAFLQNNREYLIPFILIFIGLVYGLIFYILALISKLLKIYMKIPSIFSTAIFLSIVSYIHPFNFDWFRLELIFTDSYFSVQKYSFLIILFSISFSIYKKKIIYLIFIIFAISNQNSNIDVNNSNRKIEIVETKITIEDKWDIRNRNKYIFFVLNKIDNSIKLNKKIIIFPESIFPFALNKNIKLMNRLTALSKDITIILGALYFNNKKTKNSTYIFYKSKYQIIHKVILVPFGEESILPKWLNKILDFNLKIKYKKAKKKEFINIKINNIFYRNAICFEGTSEFFYQNSPKHMIVISNNGWFYPSIESTLQKIILKFYSKKYQTTVYHSSNMSKSYTITP